MQDDDGPRSRLIDSFNMNAGLFEDVDPTAAAHELAWAQENLCTLLRFEDVARMELMPSYLVSSCDGPGNFRIIGQGTKIRKTVFADITDSEWINFYPVFEDVGKRFAYQTRHRILDDQPVGIVYLNPHSYVLMQESMSGFSADNLPAPKHLIIH